MTISYQLGVSSGSFRGFTKLLFKWKGSVYKLVYKELVWYSIGYIFIRLVYQFILEDAQQSVFEQLSLYCARYIDLIPLSFVLGFYVTFVVQRWWTQFISIPFPDKLMNTIVVYVDGSDEKSRWIRRTLMRYWNLSFILLMRSVSTAVNRRFSTLEDLVNIGYMTEEEFEIYAAVDVSINKFWIPMTWFLFLVKEARSHGIIKDNIAVKHIVEELNDSRDKLKLLWCHDWVTLPLVYTQVVTWATHLFFIFSLLGRQYLRPEKHYPGHEIDYYVPFFTIIQFLFYMGWLKVAEELLNPFGEDDDDIECNWLVDRHLQASYIGVDELYKRQPNLSIDRWDSRHFTNATSEFSQCCFATNDYVMQIKLPSNGSPNLTKRICCCRKKDKDDKVFRMVGRPDLLLTKEALHLLNQGRWIFSKGRRKSRLHLLPLETDNNSIHIELDGSCKRNGHSRSGRFKLSSIWNPATLVSSRRNTIPRLSKKAKQKLDPEIFVNHIGNSKSQLTIDDIVLENQSSIMTDINYRSISKNATY